MTAVLAILVIAAIVGQAGLIIWLRHRHTLDARQVAEARAHLLEDAADRQLVATNAHTAKLSENNKGLGSD